MDHFMLLGILAALLAVVAYFATRSSSPAASTNPSFVVLTPGANGKKRNAPATAAAPTPDLTGPEVVLYYGSQTGTAEGFARKMCDEFRARTFNARVVDLDEFDAVRVS